jgi:hypothetical protein
MPNPNHPYGELDLVEAVRRHARANYTKGGWDYVIECWADGDILEVIEDATTPAQAIAKVAPIVKLIAEREQDARSEIF